MWIWLQSVLLCILNCIDILKSLQKSPIMSLVNTIISICCTYHNVLRNHHSCLFSKFNKKYGKQIYRHFNCTYNNAETMSEENTFIKESSWMFFGYKLIQQNLLWPNFSHSPFDKFTTVCNSHGKTNTPPPPTHTQTTTPNKFAD